MAELADALRSGRSGLTLVGVQVPPAALRGDYRSLLFCFSQHSILVMQMATVPPSAPAQPRSIRPLLFALLILTLLILASYVGRLRNISALDQQIAAAEVNVEQAMARRQSLQNEQARQEDANSERIDQAARRDLNLVKPGDFTFTVLTPVPSSLPTATTDSPAAEPATQFLQKKPNWKQWLELLLPDR